MTKTLLPTMTPEQCASITGITRNHAAHTVYTTRILYHGIQHMPIGQCPGKHEYTAPAVPADPFAGIAEAYGDEPDRDL
jgi:hypothetical protein